MKVALVNVGMPTASALTEKVPSLPREQECGTGFNLAYSDDQELEGRFGKSVGETFRSGPEMHSVGRGRPEQLEALMKSASSLP